MTQTAAKIFDAELAIPDKDLTRRAEGLLGFESRYAKVRDQLRLLLSADELERWNRKYHGGKLALVSLAADQYPLAIFHGDVGTGKTATAECIANRLVDDSRIEDCVLFKLSNRVRGSGKVGEMGTLLADAFHEVTTAAGRSRRAILIIDEGDSLAASRAQDHSHHEDKVAVNTLIQGIDDLRSLGGRVLVILCTNRLSVLDPALQRRAAIIEEFNRPNDEERYALFQMDLEALEPSKAELGRLVKATGPKGDAPGWTYSDIRTRLYPVALARAFPDRGLTVDDLEASAAEIEASPAMEDC
jgi:SpoVK/Ycf46/Vps4 family AAA+-type ATPase